MSALHVLLAADGGQIAADIRNFAAPLAAVIIGVIGLKYLFGENKSLAGFIGFLFLGLTVFALIKWGDGILDGLGDTFRSWVDAEPITVVLPQFSDYLLALGAAVAVLVGGGLARARRAARENADPVVEELIEAAEKGDEEARQRLARLREEPVLMDRAEQVALEWIPTNAREAKRLVNQVRFAMLVMSSRGLLAKESPVTPEHVAKWVLLNEKWPDLVERIVRNPDVLGQLEREMGDGESEQRSFLLSSPPLRPVIKELLHVLPRGATSDGEVATQ
ncbi:hypothetical protein FKR81_42730 [Lentzea tibetensis]|uniref:Uncharacterized protein n=1 Tax=Lentzea tibetensis TaxID=2591470 RepID=A0A563EEP8_9PSEU|nr:hypothetical protein [Lentzea tibetensis]TWP43241.1 hypothetical protein FKR81_42730 [Lentzea tibetensis]